MNKSNNKESVEQKQKAFFCKACGIVKHEEYEAERRRRFDAQRWRAAVLAAGRC